MKTKKFSIVIYFRLKFTKTQLSVYTHCKKCALSVAFYISIARLNHSGVHWCQRRKVSCLRCVFNKVFEYDVKIKGTVTDRIILKKLEKED